MTGPQQCPSAMGPRGTQPWRWHRAPAPQPALPHAQPAMWHPTNPLPHLSPCTLSAPLPRVPVTPRSHSPVAPGTNKHQLLDPSPLRVLSPFLLRPLEVPSPLCSQQCWRGTAPQSPQGCPGPRGQQRPPPLSLAHAPSLMARPTSLGRHTRRGRPGRWLPPYRRQAY